MTKSVSIVGIAGILDIATDMYIILYNESMDERKQHGSVKQNIPFSIMSFSCRIKMGMEIKDIL